MKLKKVFTLLITLVVCFSLVACKKCKNHVDKNDDLVCDNCGKACDDGPDTQGGCDSHIDNNGDLLCDNCGADMGGSTAAYEPKWDLNPTGFNGQGMTIKIKCLPVNEFDPFDADYTGDSQEIKMRHQQLVQQAYNVKIEYVAYTTSEAWGNTRTTAIVDGYTNGSYQKDDIYVVNIVSSWIPIIVKSKVLAELGDIRNGEVTEGILADFNADEEKYIQNSTINTVASASNKLYGISTGKPTPDHFIYYNIDLVQKAQIEDPAELWLKGEWTVKKFTEWAETAKNALPENYVLDLGFAEFSLGLVASTGNQFVTISPIQRINFLDDDVTNCLKTIQSLYTNYYVPGRGTNDHTKEFMEGKSIMASGQFWWINDPSRWDSKANKLNIGVVPYPRANDDKVTVETTSNPDEAILGANKEPLAYNGEYVSGLNLEDSTFRIPYSSSQVFSILDYANGKNGINAKIIANMLIDLYAGVGPDPNLTEQLTEEQGFRLYLESIFDRPVDVDVVMSVYDRTYFEIFEAVSMTVGGNSQFGPDAYWPLCASICKDNTKNPNTELTAVYDKYKKAMIDMGYNPL